MDRKDTLTWLNSPGQELRWAPRWPETFSAWPPEPEELRTGVQTLRPTGPCSGPDPGGWVQPAPRGGRRVRTRARVRAGPFLNKTSLTLSRARPFLPALQAGRCFPRLHGPAGPRAPGGQLGSGAAARPALRAWTQPGTPAFPGPLRPWGWTKCWFKGGSCRSPPPSALSPNGPSPRRWHSTRPLGRVLGPTQAQEGLRTCVAAAACAARTPRTSLVPPAATLPGLWMWKCLDEMLGAMAAAGGLGERPPRLQERVCPAGADGDG